MVMSSNETLQMVLVLGHCIDDRIKELHTTIARYERTKIVLDKFHTCITSLSNSTPLLTDQMEELAVLDSKDEAFVASSSVSDNVSVSDGGEDMNKLEEILSLAREIRSVSGSKSSKAAAAVVNNTQSSLTERKDRGIIASKGGTKGKATKVLVSAKDGRNYKAQTTAPKATHHPNGSRNGSIHKPPLISSISSQKQNYMVNSIIVKKQQAVTNKVLSRRCDEAMINSNTHHHQQQQHQQQQAFARDVLAQLQFTSRYSYPVSLSKLFMNRELYAVHAEVYCKVLRTSTQPHSVLYDVVASHISSLKPERRIGPLNGSSIGPRSVTGTTHDHNGSSSRSSSSSSDHGAKTAFISKLTRAFESLLTSYDRYFKVRMSHEQFHVSQLSAPDRLTLMAMWYKGRKLLDLYNYYIKSKLKHSRSKCPCSNCVLMRLHIHTDNTKHERDVVTTVVNMHNSKPLYTPLPLPSQSQFIRESYSPSKKMPTGASSVSVDSSGQVEIVMWYNDSKKRIQNFHRTFQDKVKLMVESSVGRHQLKDTIHSLKHCCEEQIKANSNHHTKSADNSKHVTADESVLDTAIASDDVEVLLQQWIQSWKQFRSIYSILLNEAKDLNECMFINK